MQSSSTCALPLTIQAMDNFHKTENCLLFILLELKNGFMMTSYYTNKIMFFSCCFNAS